MKWYPSYWLTFVMLGDPATKNHPNIKEFLCFKMEASNEPVDLTEVLDNLRKSANKSVRRQISRISDNTSF